MNLDGDATDSGNLERSAEHVLRLTDQMPRCHTAALRPRLFVQKRQNRRRIQDAPTRRTPMGPSSTIGIPAAMVRKPTELFVPVRSKFTSIATNAQSIHPNLQRTWQPRL